MVELENAPDAAESRSDRRKRRNRQAIIEAAHRIMTEKGIDAATMYEIAEAADVASGTAYNYFSSKDELAVAVIELVMNRLGRRIEAVTHKFTDPAQVYAFGVRQVMIAATTDHRWRSLLRRPDAIAGAMFRVLGLFAIRDIKAAVASGRCKVEEPELVWRMAAYAIVGFSLGLCEKEVASERIEDAVVNLLCMVGVLREEAWEIARRPCPRLPDESEIQEDRPRRRKL
jgi:AcrR family transcriptional regulator